MSSKNVTNGNNNIVFQAFLSNEDVEATRPRLFLAKEYVALGKFSQIGNSPAREFLRRMLYTKGEMREEEEGTKKPAVKNQRYEPRLRPSKVWKLAEKLEI